MKSPSNSSLPGVFSCSLCSARRQRGRAKTVSLRLIAATTRRQCSFLTPLAQRGDVWSQSYVGFMYWEGLGVPQNFAAAAIWSQLAADKGNGDAQQNLAMAYKNGWGS